MSRAYAKENPRVKKTRCKLNPLHLFLAFFCMSMKCKAKRMLHPRFLLFPSSYSDLFLWRTFVKMENPEMYPALVLQCSLSLCSKETSQHARLLIVTQLVRRANMLRPLLSSLLKWNDSSIIKNQNTMLLISCFILVIRSSRVIFHFLLPSLSPPCCCAPVCH